MTQVFYYSPWRYLQTMFAIAWAAFAHPFFRFLPHVLTPPTNQDGQSWHPKTDRRFGMGLKEDQEYPEDSFLTGP